MLLEADEAGRGSMADITDEAGLRARAIEGVLTQDQATEIS
jgi:hypothetical protein